MFATADGSVIRLVRENTGRGLINVLYSVGQVRGLDSFMEKGASEMAFVL